MADSIHNGCPWRVVADDYHFMSSHRTLRNARLAAARLSFSVGRTMHVESYDRWDGVRHVWFRHATYQGGVETHDPVLRRG